MRIVNFYSATGQHDPCHFIATPLEAVSESRHLFLHRLIMKVKMRPSFSKVSAGKLLLEPGMVHTHTHTHLCNTHLNTCHSIHTHTHTHTHTLNYVCTCMQTYRLPVTQSQLSTAVVSFDVSDAIRARFICSRDSTDSETATIS